MAELIRTKAEAQVFVGRTIKAVELNPMEEEDGTISFRPVLRLDDGSCMAFDAHMTDAGDSVVLRYVSAASIAQTRASLKRAK